MAKSKKITGFNTPTGFTGEVTIPTSIDSGLVKQIGSDVFKDKGVTKIIANTFSDDAISGAPWGATDANIWYKDVAVINPPTISANLTYNGSEQAPTITGFDSNSMTKSGEESAVNAGTYTILVNPKSGYKWTDGTIETKQLVWSIAQKSISTATVTLNGSLTYNGAAQTQYVASVIVDSLPATYSVSNNVQTNAGDYTLTCTGNGNFTGSVDKAFNIAQKSISTATVTLGASLTYNGSEQTQTVASVVVDGLNATYTISDNKGTNVGNYTLTCNGNGNFTGSVNANWSISILKLTIPTLSDTSKTYNGSVQSPTVNNYNSTYENISGNSATNAGNYTVTWTLKDTINTQWVDDTTESKTADWSIAQKSISGATVTLGSSLTYNGASQTQTVTSVKIDGLNATYAISDNVQTNAGDYTLTVTGNGNFTGSQTKAWSIAKAAGTLSISPTSVAFSKSVLTATVTVTSNCLGTFSISSLTGVSTSIANNVITLTGDGSTDITSGSMTISVTPDANHTAPSNVNLSVSANYFDPTGYSRVGGRIFFINVDYGATYEFRAQEGALLSTQTVAGLADAYWYKITSGTPTADKFYVYDTVNGLSSDKQWGKYGTGHDDAHGDSYSSGKYNTALYIAESGWEANSIFTHIQELNATSPGGCNDWYIGSQTLNEELRLSGLVDWFSRSGQNIWTSSEAPTSDYKTFAIAWERMNQRWGYAGKYLTRPCFAVRSF